MKTWQEWDSEYTQKIFCQDRTLETYYLTSSALPKLDSVRKPTLIIHSQDDPIVSVDCLPVKECLANPNLIVGLVKKGGHVCFFQGLTGQKRWYPLVSSEYLDSVIELREESLRGPIPEPSPHLYSSQRAIAI